MNRENVLKVADAIEQHSIPDLGFYMGDFTVDLTTDFRRNDDLDRSGNKCSTVACIAGWTQRLRTGAPIVVVPFAKFDWEGEAPWLGLSEEQAESLFFGHDADGESRVDLDEATPAQAVAVLRHLADTGEVDWSVADKVAAN